MTNRTPNRPGSGVVTRTTDTKERMRETLAKAKLTQEEENVLRMRHGVSEPGGHRLETRGQDNPETRAKLALLEKSIIDAMRRRPDPTDPVYAARKARILKKLSDD